MLKYRHPQLGRAKKLDIRKGGIGTVLVWQAQLHDLVSYLNRSEKPGVKRVLDILALMHELESIEPPVFSERIEGPMMVEIAGRFEPNPLLKKIAPEKYHLQLRIDRIQGSINRKLARYRFWPSAFLFHGSPWTVTWSPLKAGTGCQMGEMQALEVILNLARSGYLNRMRRCVCCHNWLYAQFRHQTFCSLKCQQKQYTQTEEFKAKRRGYMRRYYQQNFASTSRRRR